MLIFNKCIRGLMPNLNKKSWTVSSLQGSPKGILIWPDKQVSSLQRKADQDCLLQGEHIQVGSFKFEGCFCSRKLLADVNWECLTLLITVVNFDESFVCSKMSRLTRLLFSVQPIQMSHWCHTMVDGTKLWITCKWLKLQRKAGHLQLIRNTVPSTIVWRQCDIRIIAS